MKRAILLFSVAVAFPVLADDAAPLTFDDRVSLAKLAEDDERFHPYPAQMVKDAARRLARTMRHCWTLSAKPDAKSFVLVADIQLDGRPRDVEVKPAHAVARCFAAGFSANRYLAPPDYPGLDAFPVTMRVGGGS